MSVTFIFRQRTEFDDLSESQLLENPALQPVFFMKRNQPVCFGGLTG
jgi:hypothetical protein